MITPCNFPSLVTAISGLRSRDISASACGFMLLGLIPIALTSRDQGTARNR